MPGAKPPEPDALMSTRSGLSGLGGSATGLRVDGGPRDTGDYVLQRPGAEPELVKGDRVTASFFDVLRARPMLGAAFTSRNEVAGSDRVVVVSHAFWQRRLGRDPSAVGRIACRSMASPTRSSA